VTPAGKGILGVIAAVAIAVVAIGLLSKGKHAAGTKAGDAVASYCRTTKAGHTVMLNTTMALGDPDTRVDRTVDGVRVTYLGYGPVTFSFNDDTTRLIEASGC
jgi:hypothetical protein